MCACVYNTCSVVQYERCTRVCVTVCVRKGKRLERERGKKRGMGGGKGVELHVFASDSNCTQVHFDGRTSSVDRSVPILAFGYLHRLSLRNRTKPVSRHFGANQWQTDCLLIPSLSLFLFPSVSLSGGLYHCGLLLSRAD